MFNKVLSLRYSLDTLIALITAALIAGVLQTFVIGQHYLIPTGLLTFAVLLGNFARFGFSDRRWAKQVNFWIGFVLTSHVFFALFWSRKYREILGDAFEIVGTLVFLLLGFLTVQYARRNKLFSATDAS